MATSSSKPKSNGHNFSNHFQQRSLSPSGRFCSSSSTFSNFSPARPSPIHHSQPSPAQSRSIRFSSISPNRSISVSSWSQAPPAQQQKKQCACSPTTHRGSYRCGLHKRSSGSGSSSSRGENRSSCSNQLNMRRSAMTNSLVRIGTVEGELVKRALAALIRPSSHQLRRRGGFKPRPSRLSVMFKNGDS